MEEKQWVLCTGPVVLTGGSHARVAGYSPEPRSLDEVGFSRFLAVYSFKHGIAVLKVRILPLAMLPWAPPE